MYNLEMQLKNNIPISYFNKPIKESIKKEPSDTLVAFNLTVLIFLLCALLYSQIDFI